MSKIVLDIEQMKKEVEDILWSKKVNFQIVQGKRAEYYLVEAKEVRLTIRLDKDWIGYELKIKDLRSNGQFSISNETDNYPVQGEYIKISKEIFDDLIYTLKALLDGKILTAEIDRKPVLIVPEARNMWKLYIKGRFMTRIKQLNAKQLNEIRISDPTPVHI